VILYGQNPVKEALRGRRAHDVSEVWAIARVAREPWLGELRVRVVSAEEIEHRCGSSAHQGVCAETGGYPYVSAEELLRSGKDPLLVALDQVQDPQNLGSICRTAECAGASGVVIPERRAVEVTPAVCKASAGAVEHLRLARVRNMADFLGEARKAGCWCYGASAHPIQGMAGPAGAAALGGGAGKTSSRRAAPAGRAPVAYDAPDYRGAVVLVLGSESTGLRPRVAAACDELIALPLRGSIESLGVAAAAAALLYGILQNRSGSLDSAP
jgi:23S rRNA (guanosine2251-2'-O)-methyltransferase